jgi:transposase
MKNRIHGILTQFGITPPAISDLFGKEGMLWLKDLTLPGPYAVSLKGYLELIEEVEHLINEADKQIKAGLKNSPAAWLLDTVPGVGILTAHLVIAEIGDINRFPSAKKLCSYGRYRAFDLPERRVPLPRPDYQARQPLPALGIN